jgi:DNA-binding NarL/FixJ family response regulator
MGFRRGCAILPVRVLIADDQRLVLAGLRRLVEGVPGVAIVAEASVCDELVSMAASSRPDLIVMELVMNGLEGIDAIARIKGQLPDCRILIVSARGAHDLVRRALGAGASGYILKDSAPVELRLAIKAVLRGDSYLSPAVSRAAASGLVPARRRDPDVLSPRQREILKLIAKGHCTKRIAQSLGVSVKTVETHRAALMERLDIHHVPGLVFYALRHSLVRLDTGGGYRPLQERVPA